MKIICNKNDAHTHETVVHGREEQKKMKIKFQQKLGFAINKSQFIS